MYRSPRVVGKVVVAFGCIAHRMRVWLFIFRHNYYLLEFLFLYGALSYLPERSFAHKNGSGFVNYAGILSKSSSDTDRQMFLFSVKAWHLSVLLMMFSTAWIDSGFHHSLGSSRFHPPIASRELLWDKRLHLRFHRPDLAIGRDKLTRNDVTRNIEARIW